MTGVAQGLSQSGMLVTATAADPTNAARRLRRLGVSISDRPLRTEFTERSRLLIHEPEIRREHPTRLAALRRGIRQETPSGWLGERLAGGIGVAVVGGREASASAAMTGFVLAGWGADPSVFLGSCVPQLGGWARDGSGPHVVAEWTGDAAGFEKSRPAMSLLLNVGADPLVDRDAWSGAFRQYLRAIPSDGSLLALGHPSFLDGPEKIGDARGLREWVSLQHGSDWWGTDLREESGQFRFRIFHQGRYVIEIRLRVTGLRNVLAALTSVAACVKLGVPASVIREGIEEFRGLSRDFEDRGSFRGVSLVDDEAEDPDSVTAAVAAARQTFGVRRLWVVYASPKNGCLPGESGRLCSAFSSADRVLIIDGDKGQEGADDDRPPRALVRALADGGVRAIRSADVVEAISELDRHLEPGDVLLTLGAGDVGTIADAFIRRLPRDRQDR